MGGEFFVDDGERGRVGRLTGLVMVDILNIGEVTGCNLRSRYLGHYGLAVW